MSQERSSVRFAPRLDAGWLFLSAGVILMASVALIGPLDDLALLRYRRDRLAALEQAATEQLEAYLVFLEAVEEEDPMLMRRLVAAQMNQIPATDEVVGMVGDELDAHVDHWIQSTLPGPAYVEPPIQPDSWLRKLSTGANRLWTLLAGAVLVFIGLLGRSTKTEEQSEPAPALPEIHTLSVSPHRAGARTHFEVAPRPAEPRINRAGESISV